GLYQFSPNWYAGIRYWWDDYKIPRRDSAGLLIENTVTGHSGGVISGGGPLLTYDSRDHIFFPSKGLFIETEFYINKKYFGSDFNFTRFSLDAKAYISDNRKGVWALNVYLVSLSGKPPFQQLALLGGAKRMRGYFEGRYRDRNLWMFQAEYRFPLYRRTGGVAFGGVGNVSPSVQTLFSQKVHLTFGAGVRILLAEKDHINLRFDVGANEQGEVFPYLTVAEAF
ncbi:MAG TPA: hypothetical protein ENJ20_07370, partial [Bacteroidetes bacterium]|nr:hypothetical protein [Bacteroidota bacterium]